MADHQQRKEALSYFNTKCKHKYRYIKWKLIIFCWDCLS